MILEQLQSTALMGVEATINQALQYDPATRNAITKLDGKVLAVESTLPNLELFVIHSGDSLSLMSHYEGVPDTILKGSALSLVTLALDNNDRSSFVGTGVEVRGDAELLRQVRKIMRNLDVDWEAMLSKLIGDVPAHLIGETVRSLNSWRREAAPRVGDVVKGFHQEEVKLGPSRNEAEQFFNEVSQLNKAVDRIGARINALLTKLDQQNETRQEGA